MAKARRKRKISDDHQDLMVIAKQFHEILCALEATKISALDFSRNYIRLFQDALRASETKDNILIHITEPAFTTVEAFYGGFDPDLSEIDVIISTKNIGMSLGLIIDAGCLSCADASQTVIYPRYSAKYKGNSFQASSETYGGRLLIWTEEEGHADRDMVKKVIEGRNVFLMQVTPQDLDEWIYTTAYATIDNYPVDIIAEDQSCAYATSKDGVIYPIKKNSGLEIFYVHRKVK